MGCADLLKVDWGRGAAAVRCMSSLPPAGKVLHHGRVLQVFPLGTVSGVRRPAWCPRRKEDENP